MNNICNINKEGILLRRTMGLISMSAVIFGSVIFITFQLKATVLVVLFLVFFMAFFELLQAKLKFCVIFGMAGKDNSKGKMKNVSAALAKEYASYSNGIIFASLVLATLVSAVVFLCQFVAINLL